MIIRHAKTRRYHERHTQRHTPRNRHWESQSHVRDSPAHATMSPPDASVPIGTSHPFHVQHAERAPRPREVHASYTSHTADSPLITAALWRYTHRQHCKRTKAYIQCGRDSHAPRDTRPLPRMYVSRSCASYHVMAANGETMAGWGRSAFVNAGGGVHS